MKYSQQIGLLLFLLAQLTLCGCRRYESNSTHAVSRPLPMNGAQAVTQSLDCPSAVIVDNSGGFYISSDTQYTICRVASNGSIRVIAGVGSYGFSGDGGPAIAAQLNYPSGMAIDSADNLYIADSGNYRIRKITTAGIISTVVGNGTRGYCGDGGPATAAQLNGAVDIAIDSSGNLFIADMHNHKIRRVTPAGIISTVVGNGTEGYGGDGGPATAAQLGYPIGVAVDSASNLYIADSTDGRIRKVTPTGVISSVPVKSIGNFSGEGTDKATTELTTSADVAVDSAGNLYISEILSNRIRKITTEGIISTVAGNGTRGYGGDGGPATAAKLNNPRGVAVDAAGNLYVADSNNYRIRKITTAGIISTVAGNGTGDTRTAHIPDVTTVVGPKAVSLKETAGPFLR
jgi:trimeric autotransporter adhesin